MVRMVILGCLWLSCDLLLMTSPGLFSFGDILLIYPTVGVALGLMTLWGPRYWPGILVGAGASSLYYWLFARPGRFAGWDWSILLSASHVLVQTSMVAGMAWCLRRAARRGSAPLDNVRQTLIFIAVVALLGPAYSTLLSHLPWWAAGQLGDASLIQTAPQWFASALLGNLVLAAVIIRWGTRSAWWHVRLRDAWIGLLLLVLLLFAGSFIFLPDAPLTPSATIGSFGLAWGLPLMIAAALFYGQIGATAALAIGAGFAVIGAILGTGPFDQPDTVDRIIAMHISASALAVTLLLVGAIVSERMRQTRRLVRQSQQLLDRRDRLRRMTAHVLGLEHRERRDLAVRLHDTVGQYLAVARMRLNDEDCDADNLQEVEENLDRAIKAGRDVIADLSPPTLHRLGLGAAMNSLATTFEDQHGVVVSLARPPQTIRGAFELESFLFRAARELMYNALKHASPREIHVQLDQGTDRWRVIITDDGPGFDPDRIQTPNGPGEKFGFISLCEQAEGLGGTVSVRSASPEGGAEVAVSVPYTPPDTPAAPSGSSHEDHVRR